MNIDTAYIVHDAVHALTPQLIVVMEINGHSLNIDIRGEELVRLLSGKEPHTIGVTARTSYEVSK